MEKIKNKKGKKKIIILFSIICITVIIIYALVLNKKQTEELLPHNLTTIEDVLEYYNCELIKKTMSDTDGLDYNLYVKFAKTYYDKNQSNKAYFTGIITYLSKCLDYNNYSLIDSSKQINIVIICDKEQQVISQIYYNGDRTYFETKDNEKIVNDYKETKVTELDIDSDELKKIIDNGWKNNNIYLGTQESTFEEYDIYFDEGIEVKTTASYIYNIIFTDKYKKNIVNGLKVNDSQNEITNKLGAPAFIDDNLEIVGYKSKDIYIFFSKDEVSIYRVENDYKNKQFLDLVNELVEKKEKISFLNSLTDIWNDYDLYIASGNDIFIRYTIKGVEVSFNNAGGKITYYQNFAGELEQGVTLTNLNKENIPHYAKLDLATNLVWQQEKHRKDLKKCYYNEDYIDMPSVSEYEGENRNIGTYDSKKFYLLNITDDKGICAIKFISKDKEYPNSEFKPNLTINYYGWLDDNRLIYSVTKKGIYMYDATTRRKTILVEGEEEYKLNKIESKTIYYDSGKKVKV